MIKKLIFILLLCFMSSCFQDTIEPVTFYIPEGVTGKILVIFNQEDGLPIEYEDGRRVYRIQPSGVLKTQFKVDTGSIYYWDKSSEGYWKKNNEMYKAFYVSNNIKKPIKVFKDSFPNIQNNFFFRLNPVPITTKKKFLGKFTYNIHYLTCDLLSSLKSEKKVSTIDKNDANRILQWKKFDMRVNEIYTKED